jgi:putative OPT family oligopeptide transporter
MEKKEFKPYVSADTVMSEWTAASVILGILLAILFGAANAYLGLRVGMTVSASIPAAVISMGVIRFILKKDSILENNMVQTIGSAGESLAAGAIFTLPAVYMWVNEGVVKSTPSFVTTTVVCIVGGILGIVFMIPLRKALIVKEHGVLPYPEGTACAEVLIAGEKGGAAASTVFAGLGIASVYKFVTDGLKVFPSEIATKIKGFKGAGFGMDVLPALVGVGYICGPRVSAYMFAGGLFAWVIIMPLIALFGADITMFPSTVPIKDMDPASLWSSYIRYIGAGAVATGGIISLIKSLPLIFKTFSQSMKSLTSGEGNDVKIDRTNEDISSRAIIIMIVALILVLAFFPGLPFNLFTAVLVLVFGFFFATVASRMVGLVGSSNNPASGMAIATLLFSTILLKATGTSGPDGMVSAIMVGTVICIIACIAGDISQDLKTGYIVGATPKKQQVGEIVGVIASGIAIAFIIDLLNKAWGFGSAELPAPQATLMKLVVEGVMGGNLPWTLVFIGAFIAIVIEVLGIPVLPVAIGLYLPIYTSSAIMVGGIARYVVERMAKKRAGEEKAKEATTSGVLYCSGLIAGEGLVGILLAVFAIIPSGSGTLSTAIDLSSKFSIGGFGSVVCFALLVFSVFLFSFRKKKEAAAEADK